MKLHLPKKLFSALLACCSMLGSIVTTAASSTMLVGALSFTLLSEQSQAYIWTWIGAGENDNISNAANMQNASAGTWPGDVTYQWDGTGQQGFRESTADTEYSNGQNMLKFTDAVAGTRVLVDFNTLAMGGLYVQTEATGFSMTPSGTNARTVTWNASVQADSNSIGGVFLKTNFIMEEDFSFGNGVNGTWTNWSYTAGANYDIAAGKTFTIYANQMLSSGEAPATPYEHLIHGGGTLKLILATNYNLSDNAKWSISQGSTMDLSSITAGATANLGTVTISNGVINMGANGATLSSALTIGALGGTVQGSNITLTGSINYSLGGPALNISGSVSLDSSLVINLGNSGDLANGTYTLFTRDNDTSTLDYNLAQLTITGLADPLRIQSLEWVGDELQLVVGDSLARRLTLETGDATWDTNASNTPWDMAGANVAFGDGDVVTIGATGQLGGTITLVGDLAPASTVVQGDGAWVFTGDGSIADGTLTVTGNATLTIENTNSYDGGTILTGGTTILAADTAVGTGDITLNGASAVLEIAHATGLGDATIRYTAGTIRFSDEFSTSLHDKITLDAATTSLSLDLNGQSLTWAEAVTVNLNLSNSDPDNESVFSYGFSLDGRTVTLGENTVLHNTVQTAGGGVSLSGAGTFRVNYTDNAIFYLATTTGFTGVFEAHIGASLTVLDRSNTVNDRFFLSTETTAAEVTQLQAIVLGSANWASDSTLFLSGLSGYSNISTSNGTPTNRSINILMTEDNTYHGDLYTAANDGRWGTLTIGGDGFTFNWTGQTTMLGTNYTSIGTNANLLITEGATMNFATDDAGTSGGQWADEIAIEERGTLLISRTDATGFVQQAAGNEISGAGQVAVSGNATLNAANTYTGGTVVRDGGTLTIGTATTLSTGAISVNTGGHLTTSVGLTSAALVTNEGQLTLGGTVQLSQSITNTGTITLGADAVIDLSTLTATAITNVDALTTTYAFATGAGTVDFSAFVNAEGFIDISKITGVTVAGRQWTINEQGLLTALVVANNLNYRAGGTLDISNATIYDGGAAFEEGDSVFVSGASAHFNVTEAVEFSLLDVDGVSLSIGGMDNSLTVALLELRNGASVEIQGDVMVDGYVIVGSAGNELILDLGNTGTMTEDQLTNFVGQLTIESGSLSTNDPAHYEAVTVKGGTLSLQAGTGIGTNITLDGGTLSFEDGGAGNFTGSIYTGDGSTIEVVGADNTVTGTWAANNIWSGEGTVYKTGAGTLSLDMIVHHRGTLDIVEGAYNFGLAETGGADLGFSKVIIRDGATFQFQHNSDAQMQNATFVFDGGTFHSFDADLGDNRIGTFEITGDSNFNATYNGNFIVETVTGSANLSFGGGITEALTVDFENIVDYNGSIILNASANLAFNMGNVEQAAGNELIITGAAFTANGGLTKKGAGSLLVEENVNITGMLDVYEGQLTMEAITTADGFRQLGNATTNIDTLTLSNNALFNMNYEGTLNIDTLNLGEVAILNYTGETNVFNLTDAALRDVTLLRLIVSDLDLTTLEAGIDLGIDSGFDIANLSLEGYTDDTTFEIQEIGGTWHLTATALGDLGWDPNWGAAVLGQRPTIVPVVADLEAGNLALFDNADTYVIDGVARIKVEGGGSATTRLIGGMFAEVGESVGRPITGDTWIEVAGGTFSLVVGGNYANNWNATERADFTGDSHIYVTGGTINNIIGGNMRDGDGVVGTGAAAGPTFTGDVYISVAGGIIEGGIIGSTTSPHGAESTMIGDIHIAVYTPLSVNGTTNVDGTSGPYHVITGGALHLAGTTGSYTQTGNSNILIDLSEYTGAATNFTKHIIGGSTANSDYITTLDGSTNVEVIGNANVTFTDRTIYGGTRAQGSGTQTITGDTTVKVSGEGTFFQILGSGDTAGGTSTIEGDTNVIISGGMTVSSWVMGMAHITGGTHNILGDTNLTIDGTGVFKARVTGASNLNGGTGRIGGTSSITVNGGTFEMTILGGFNQHNNTSTIDNGTYVHITDAIFNNTNTNAVAIAAGGLHAAGTMTVTGGTHLVIDDITYTAGAVNRHITGGMSAEGDGTTTINGGVLIDINGGTFTSELYGGHIASGVSSGTKSINGGIEVDISSGTFSSIVSGAGKISTSGVLTNTVTGSTEVNISGGSFSSTIMAGFNVIGTGTITASVDDLVLNFSEGTMTDGRLVGGHQITGTGTAPTITSGDMTVNVTGGTVNNIYGGSVVGRTGTLAQNDITINLSDATVTGNVYAAGLLSALAAVTTESTTVNLSDSVTFNGADVVVSGMYDDATAVGHLSSVAGESKLNLNSEGSTYANIAAVNFEDFSEINVVATSSASIKLSTESLTKKGAGSLSLTTGLTNAAVNVDAGTLSLAATNSLTTLEVASGATLNLAGTTTSITTSLLLNTGSSLNIAEGDASIAMAAGATASITGAHLNINGYTLGDNLNQELFADLTSLEGVTLELLFTNDYGIKANEVLSSINGEAISEDFYLVVRNGGIELLNTLVAKLTWQGGDGDLNADNWHDEANNDTPFTEFASVTFNGGTGDITVLDADADELTSIIVTGATTDYNFVTGTGATLLVQSSIEVLDGATASFEVPLNLSEANVTVAENSTLNISGTDALAMANMTNNGTITITNATTTQIEALSGTGTLTVGGTVTLTEGTTSGATLNVVNLNLAYDENSFAQLVASGTVNSRNMLNVGGTSSIDTLTGNGGLGIAAGGTLTLAKGTSIFALESEGALTVTTDDLSITGKVDDGGDVTISAGNLVLSNNAETNASFDKLLVTGNITGNAGVLSLGDGSIITGTINGGALSTTGNVSIGGDGGGFSTLTNGTGTLIINDGLVVGTSGLSNLGTIQLGSADRTAREDAEFWAGTTAGGTLLANNVTLGGDSVFTRLDAAGTVTLNGLLTVGDGSYMTTVAAGDQLGGLAASGTVTIGAVTGTLASLTNSEVASALTVGSNVTVEGAFSNDGSLSMVNYDLVVNTATDNGGAVTAKNVTLSQTGDNTFVSITATEHISAEALSVTANSSAASLSTGMTLAVGTGASFTVSGGTAIELASLTGAGDFSATHMDATLSLADNSSANSLSLVSGQLTLGGELTLTNALNLASVAQSTIALDFALDGAASAITASQLMASTNGLNIVVTAARLDALTLGDGASYIVAELGSAFTGDLFLNGSTEKLEGDTGVYEYVLGTDTDGNVIITATIQGNTWEGTSGSVWDSTTGGNWSDAVPSSSLEALFKGDDGIRDVQLVGNNLVAQSVIVSADEDGTYDPAVDYYSFSGDGLTTGTLSVSSGLLIVENDIEITSDSSIVDNGTGSLELGAGTEIQISATGSIAAEKGNIGSNSVVSVAEGGELSVDAELNMSASASIENDGQVNVGQGSVLSTVTGDGHLNLWSAGTVEAASITQGSVTVVTGGTLRVTGTATITGQLSNYGSIDATGATVNVTSAVTTGGHVMAQTLNVSGQGASFGSVELDFLNLTGDFISGSTALVTVESLAGLTGSTVTMGIDQLDSSTTGNGSYIIVGNAAASGSLSWSDIVMDSATRDEMNEIIYAGHDITYTTEADGSLSMLIEDATDRRWLMSNNFAVTEGLENNDPTVKIEPIVNNMTGDITTGISGNLSRYDILDSVQRVVIDTDYNLNFADVTLQPGDTQGLLLNNLSGLADKTLTLTGNASGDSLATMRNDTSTSFDSLVADNMSLQIEGTNDAVLSMNDMDVNGSTVTVQNNGSLYVADANFDAASQLVVGSGAAMMDRVTLDSGSAEVVSGGIYTVTETLTMLGDANMELSGTGEANIASADLSNAAQIDVTTGSLLDIDSITMKDDSILSVDSQSEANLGNVTLEGNAKLTGALNGILTVEEISSTETNTLEGHIQLKDGSYTGSYEAGTNIYVVANTGLELATSENLHLHGAADANVQLNLTDTSKSIASLQTTGSNIVLAGEGSLTLSDSSVSSSMTGGSLSFSMDSSTLISSLETGSTVETQKVFATGSNVTLSDVELIIQQSDKSTVLDISNVEGSTGLVLADVNSQTGTDGNSVTLSGVALQKYFVNARYENGQIVADLNDAAYSPLGVTANGRTGIALINNAFLKLNPQLQQAGGELANPDLAKVLDAMDVYLSTGNTQDADKLAAAVAGASSTALGSALAGDVNRQLRSVRNRTMSMGSNPYLSYDDPIQANGWIAAEGDYNKLDNDGTASGHEINNWGGTMGIDWDINREFTIGAALTGMYSTITSNVADSMEGDLSTQYLSLFSRVNAGRWSHSFIFTAGISDASISRTVNVGDYQYKSSGDTDGYSLGFLYEVGYTFALSEDSSTAWQPLLSISYQQSELGGYTETGSDASLTVGDQSVSYFSIAAGARLETIIGQNVYDRASVLSFRALAKADFGDLSSEADVAFSNSAGASGVIEGTERGAFGFEVGAGLVIPILDERSQIFMDANMDIRDKQTTINATVGYGFSF